MKNKLFAICISILCGALGFYFGYREAEITQYRHQALVDRVLIGNYQSVNEQHNFKLDLWSINFHVMNTIRNYIDYQDYFYFSKYLSDGGYLENTDHILKLIEFQKQSKLYRSESHFLNNLSITELDSLSKMINKN
jgi:hypothetical protein